jgi:UDP-glucose 4-epimerase
MKVVVTGGAGFIGSWVVDRLLEAGNDVIVVDNLSSNGRVNIEGHFKNEHFEFLPLDVIDVEKSSRPFFGADRIVHLAAMVSVPKSIEDPMAAFRTNTQGTLALLGLAVKHRIRRFVFASSVAVYGYAAELPLREDMPLDARSPYAASKVAAEAFCDAYRNSYGLETCVLRLTNVYGPRMKKGAYASVVSEFLEATSRAEPLKVYGSGEQTRDFVHVQDVVDAIMGALDPEKAECGVVNVGTGRGTSINELAKMFLEISGAAGARVEHLEPRTGEVVHSYADIGKARKLLGYESRVDLRSGLRSLIEWHRGEGDQSRGYPSTWRATPRQARTAIGSVGYRSENRLETF